MDKVKNFANSKPLVFAFLVILIWLVLGAGLVFGSAALMQLPLVDEAPQMIGTLGAIIILLFLSWRMGWLRGIGIIDFGSWRIWLITLFLMLYLISAYLYGFFGKIAIDLRFMVNDENVRNILLRQGVVGFVEETLFRGIILYALTRVWGHARRGLIAAVVVQAALFGLIHVLQALAGNPISSVLMVIVNGFLSGIWWGALAMRWGSVWPFILMHAASNAAVAIHGLTTPFIEPATTAYLRATLFELPLVALGVGLLMLIPLSAPAQYQGADAEEIILA